MIKDSQEKYLATRPDKNIQVQPFNPKARETGIELEQELKQLFPDLKVYFWGAAALGIAGQNDIDINIFSIPSEYDKYRPILENVYGKPARIGTSIKWELKRNGFDVELYLTDKNSPATLEQLRVFEILSSNEQLRNEYEQLKLPYGEKDYKTYMRKKYEFFNKILGLDNA